MATAFFKWSGLEELQRDLKNFNRYVNDGRPLFRGLLIPVRRRIVRQVSGRGRFGSSGAWAARATSTGWQRKWRTGPASGKGYWKNRTHELRRSLAGGKNSLLRMGKKKMEIGTKIKWSRRFQEGGIQRRGPVRAKGTILRWADEHLSAGTPGFPFVFRRAVRSAPSYRTGVMPSRPVIIARDHVPALEVETLRWITRSPLFRNAKRV